MPRKRTSVAESMETRIHVLRGQSVVFDFDLAKLYGVDTKVLLQSVKRNASRFPADFMFKIHKQELANLRSQIVTSSLDHGHGGRRYLPCAFTEQGIAMLSSVLRSETAARVNIEIMRAFVRMRRAAIVSHQLTALIDDLSKRVDAHDAVIADIVRSIRGLVASPRPKSRPIGFTVDLEGAKN